MMFIILTAEQAASVRGITEQGHALQPILLKDGTFMLPVSVLDDPAHAAFADILGVLPQRAVDLGTPSDVLDAPNVGGEIETNPIIVKQFSYLYSYRNASPIQQETQSEFVPLSTPTIKMRAL